MTQNWLTQYVLKPWDKNTDYYYYYFRQQQHMIKHT